MKEHTMYLHLPTQLLWTNEPETNTFCQNI